MTTKFLTIDDFGRAYGPGRTKTYYLIGEGALRAVKVGRRTLIEVASADAYMAALPHADIRCRRATRGAV